VKKIQEWYAFSGGNNGHKPISPWEISPSGAVYRGSSR